MDRSVVCFELSLWLVRDSDLSVVCFEWVCDLFVTVTCQWSVLSWYLVHGVPWGTPVCLQHWVGCLWPSPTSSPCHTAPTPDKTKQKINTEWKQLQCCTVPTPDQTKQKLIYTVKPIYHGTGREILGQKGLHNVKNIANTAEREIVTPYAFSPFHISHLRANQKIG